MLQHIDAKHGGLGVTNKAPSIVHRAITLVISMAISTVTNTRRSSRAIPFESSQVALSSWIFFRAELAAAFYIA